jgi:hypothetical protein
MTHREKTTYGPIHSAERDEKRSDRPELGIDHRTVPQHGPCVSRPRDRGSYSFQMLLAVGLAAAFII